MLWLYYQHVVCALLLSQPQPLTHTPLNAQLDDKLPADVCCLAGPNMAGKSTILRSVCAVALLSACGLYAPVESAVVPYTDAFMLRNFSADSPLEGKSSFAVEMVEMRYVCSNAILLSHSSGI